MSEQIRQRKRELRVEMRRLVATIDDVDERSVRLWSHVRDEPAVRAARVVMAFTALGGEPDTAPFLAWCTSVGKTVVVPSAAPDAVPPVAPQVPDVVIVPGLGFTADGRRLGQGGGWYDRFLPDVRADCATIGVGFAPQLVAEMPIESHDVRLTMVVTDEGRAVSGA